MLNLPIDPFAMQARVTNALCADLYDIGAGRSRRFDRTDAIHAALQSRCPDCNGSGAWTPDSTNYPSGRRFECESCGGTGIIADTADGDEGSPASSSSAGIEGEDAGIVSSSPDQSADVAGGNLGRSASDQGDGGAAIPSPSPEPESLFD